MPLTTKTLTFGSHEPLTITYDSSIAFLTATDSLPIGYRTRLQHYRAGLELSEGVYRALNAVLKSQRKAANKKAVKTGRFIKA